MLQGHGMRDAPRQRGPGLGQHGARALTTQSMLDGCKDARRDPARTWQRQLCPHFHFFPSPWKHGRDLPSCPCLPLLPITRGWSREFPIPGRGTGWCAWMHTCCTSMGTIPQAREAHGMPVPVAGPRRGSCPPPQAGQQQEPPPPRNAGAGGSAGSCREVWTPPSPSN